MINIKATFHCSLVESGGDIPENKRYTCIHPVWYRIAEQLSVHKWDDRDSSFCRSTLVGET